MFRFISTKYIPKLKHIIRRPQYVVVNATSGPTFSTSASGGDVDNDAIPVKERSSRGGDSSPKSFKVPRFYNPMSTDLFHAVNNNDIGKLTRLIEKNAPLGFDVAPIHFVSSADAVNLLVANGVDVDCRSFDGKTPLIYAAKRGFHDAVDALIAANADIDAVDSLGNSAIHYAHVRNHQRVAKSLRDAGAYVADTDKTSRNFASKLFIKAFRETGHIEPSATANQHFYHPMSTELFHAIKHDDIDLARVLVQSQGNAGFEVFPLHFARSDEAVEFILENKGNLEASYIHGRTPLVSACLGGHTHAIRALINAKANVHVRTRENETALSYAIRSSDDSVDALIRAGADIHGTFGSINTPYLLMAARLRKNALVQTLVDAKADVNSVDDIGVTAASAAARSGDAETVRIIMEAKADVSVTDLQGRTALSAAVIYNTPEVVKELLRYNADPNGRSKNGHTVLMSAVRNANSDVVKVLLDAKADVHVTKAKGHTALSTAVLFSASQAVKHMIDAKANVNCPDLNGVQPLMVAARNGHYPLVRMLCDAKADPNAQDSRGGTAMQDAAKAGYPKIVTFLSELTKKS